jgi:hypothetical protein
MIAGIDAASTIIVEKGAPGSTTAPFEALGVTIVRA